MRGVGYSKARREPIPAPQNHHGGRDQREKARHHCNGIDDRGTDRPR